MFGIRFNTTPGQYVLPADVDTIRAFDDPECITKRAADRMSIAEHKRAMQATQDEEDELLWS